MIKSTKTSLKFANKHKQNELKEFISAYRDLLSQFVDIMWEMEDVKPLADKTITSQIHTKLSARITQCAGKQASAIVRGTKKKQSKRKYVIDRLNAEGKFKKARKLQRVYDEVSITKPRLDRIEPELDSRFVAIDLDNATSFDGWLTLSSLGDKQKFILPFKKSRHFNKMLRRGTLKAGVRISNSNITFMFDLPEVETKEVGATIGIDIGMKTVLSCSDDYISQKNKHGHDLDTITTIISRKKKGSKAFVKADAHRTNYINWTVNRLSLYNVQQVNLEDIKYLRYKSKRSRKLGHWTYTKIFDKLESRCSEQGVLVRKVNPTYTSQRCSSCGWTRKSNRKGKMFKCGHCNFTLDSDLNASRNIALPLPPIWKKQRLQKLNREGFYWLVPGQNPSSA